MWPTPSSQEAGTITADQIQGEAKPNQRLYSKKTGKHMQVTLGRAVKLWPTPSARDHKDSPGMSQTGINPDGSTRKRDDQLARRVYSQDEVNPDGGSLNPQWVEWLQGFQIGWTDLNN
jgi:hypothetical protein